MDVVKRLSSLQEISKAQLSKIFSVNPNRKYLIIEPRLIKPLERVCGVRWLKASGVEKIFKLESIAPNFSDNVVFYMIYPELKVFSQVVDQIRAQVDIENPPNNKFHIICIPQISYLFEEELEQYGLLESVVRIHCFQWMPIHLDTGILSLEVPLLYKTLFVNENFILLPVLSKSLWQLCFVTGKPRVILALGSQSNNLLNQYDSLCEDRGETDQIDSEFGALIIIDRNVDYTSALLTPGIYSGLLNEVYTVTAGICESTKTNSKNPEEDGPVFDEKCNPVPKKQPVSITLNSNMDIVYADIKNRFFTEVTSVLSNLTKELKSEKMYSKEMALDEIKRYVQTQLQATKSRKKFISNHLLAAESIINALGHRYEKQKKVETDIMKNSNKSSNITYLEESIATENDKLMSLRLFCLIAISQKLTGSEINSFWRKFLLHFGYDYGFAYNNLINAGFIDDFNQSLTTINIPGKINLKIPKFSTSNFYINAKNLRQIPAEPDKINLKNPTCPSYVYGGAYIPLITQVAGMVLNAVPLEDIRSKLEPFGSVTVRNDNGYPLHCRTVLVYVVGGVTYAEIAACNLLETLMGTRICVMSDAVINGNDLMNGILSI
ncbi:vacuolar protein sorting-associated protein 33B [Sitophilus oryzae]|uniref:Vacuolar protein sorting-associated protein 33B n=1 Tax=Sitophilus oryzae TaxID=7048 RepID=A0A6J2XZJ2_SITOR|nr:vacuolar protein sorting-associated protein 33B [Sitophilus oryzae]